MSATESSQRSLRNLAKLPFRFPIRVYWEDTDGGGVVYHASYVRFLERARTEWLRTLGISQRMLIESQDLVLAIRSMQLEFLAPAKLDDEIEVTVDAAERGRASVQFRQTVRRMSDGVVLVEAQVRAACLTASTFRPRPLPAGWFDNDKKQDK